MNKELEEMIKVYKEARDNRCLIESIYPEFFFKFGDMLLNYIENSIPKRKVEEYLRQEQKAFDTYKKGSKENENLKNGMWKHLGAKNMCERILGIEKIVTLD